MKKFLFLVVYFLSPFILVGLLFQSNVEKYSSYSSFISMFFGVAAFTWFNWQFILSARPKFIEKIFGMDVIYRIHGMMALLSIVLVLIHQSINEDIFKESLMTQLGSWSLFIFAAISGVTLLLMVSSRLTTLQPFKMFGKLIEDLKVFRYEHLKFIHNLSIIGLVLMVVHVLMTNAVRNNVIIFTTYMSFFLISIISYLYHKILKPWILLDRSMTVTEVVEEKEGLWSIYFDHKGKVLKYMPGQFGFFRWLNKNENQEHPFTISSTPLNTETMSITVKNLGDFTKDVGDIKIGDQIIMDGPYGKFSYLHHQHEKAIVFVAAGIGITPALSMLRHMQATTDERKVILLWQLKKEEDYIFRTELEKMREDLVNFTVIPFLSKEESVDEINQRIDRNQIERIILEENIYMEKTGFYICGPSPFMQRMKQYLRELEIKNKYIHIEKFSL